MSNNKHFSKWLYWFTLGLAIVIAYKAVDTLGIAFSAIGNFVSIVTPFIIACFLAYLLYKPCRAIEETFNNTKKVKFLKKHRRGFSVATVYFIVFIILFIIINFVRPALVNSVTELAQNIPNYYNSAIEFLKNLPEDSIWSELNVTALVENMESFNVSETIVEWVDLENATKYIKGIVDAAGIVFDIFVIIVVSVYILLERKDIKSFVQNLCKAVLSEEKNKKLAEIYENSNFVLYNYITSQILDGFLVGIIASIIMSIMKIRYAVLLGFMIGLFNVIPYFGAIVAIIIAALITIFTNGFSTAAWMTIIIIVVQQIDANVINPRILGNSLKISPILVIFATTVGGAYFGVVGMFLGVPVAALIKIFILQFIKNKNEEKIEA